MNCSSNKSDKEKKNIVLAAHAGFCYGVKLAVDSVKKLRYQYPNKEIFVLGELIHNALVIKELADIGIKKVESIDEISGQNAVCVIRSHGLPSVYYEELRKKNCEIVDLTCPDVKKVQKKAYELAKSGYLLLIIGKSEHPEVVAISANAKSISENVFVVPDLASVEQITDVIKKHKKIGIVVQTTQRISILQEIISFLLPFTSELKICNTICSSTSLRQNEAKELATKSDLMIVVGSKNSANTTHLAEILSVITDTIHIEKADELNLYKEKIANAKNIGITAGASTPQTLIDNVINELKNKI